MRVIGIDPGKSGAWCLLDDGPPVNVCQLKALPTKLSAVGKTEIDANKLLEDIQDAYDSDFDNIDLVILEKITPRPAGNSKSKGADEHTSSGQSLLSFGITLGKIKAALEILHLPTREVAPQTWKASILRDTDRSKQAAIGLIQNQFPGINLKPTPRSKPSHDWAEAVCMAMYGLKLLQGATT